MMTTRQNRQEGNLTEIMSYGVLVITPRKISVRNINKGVKALLGKEINLKVLTIPY